MFIAVYEFTIKTDMAREFRDSWLLTTKGIYEEFGSIGSRLHSTKNPLIFIGYAQWPDQETWKKEKDFISPDFILARDRMRGCVESSKTIYELEVTDDYLQTDIFANTGEN